MKNCNKIMHTCGIPTQAECTIYEGDVNEQSPLLENSCRNIEQTTQDQYNQLGEIWDEINLEELGNECLVYVETEEGKIIVKNALKKHEEKICELQERILELKTTAICDMSIESCNLNFGDLVLPCDVQPKTLGETLQLLLNQHITP